MSSEKILLLPGEQVPPSAIPKHKKKALGLGPGVRLASPQSLVATIPGLLTANHKRNNIWVENSNGKYIPSPGDLVIAQILKTTGEAFSASLSPYSTPALLPYASFESASKKNRPALPPGSLVLARVASADRHMDPELECVNPDTGKADELGLLPTSGGTVVSVSLGFARRLLGRAEESGICVLEELGKPVGAGGAGAFETVVGRNGRVFVQSADVRVVVAVCRALRETDEGGLDVGAQRKLVRRIVKEMR